MSKVAEARLALINEIKQYWRGGYYDFPEADDYINNGSRNIIDAMEEEHGEAWLGNINLYNDAERAQPIWKWDGFSIVYNFTADFVLPCDDEKLREMILARDAMEYTGTIADMEALDRIMDRINELGGVHLLWT